MILDLFKLDGKIALVTGASRGLGQAMAIALAEAGADIAGLSSGSLDETAAQVKSLGRQFLPLQVDLLHVHTEDMVKVVEQVVTGLGGIDILVNNAGTTRRAPVLEFSEQDWDDVMQVNLKAAFLLSQAAAHFMVERGDSCGFVCGFKERHCRDHPTDGKRTGFQRTQCQRHCPRLHGNGPHRRPANGPRAWTSHP